MCRRLVDFRIDSIHSPMWEFQCSVTERLVLGVVFTCVVINRLGMSIISVTGQYYCTVFSMVSGIN